MPWHKRQRLTPTRTAASRPGYFLLEAAVAMALLVAAATAVASLAASLAQERRAQMQRTAARLHAENVGERLRIADFDDLSRLAQTTTAEAAGAETETRVRIEPFTAGDIEGRHIVVTVTAGQLPAGRPRTTKLELWRFGSRSGTAAADAAGPSAAEENE